MGVPAQFRIDAEASRRCLRQEENSFVFDFTGMAPLPEDDMECRLVVLLDEIESFRRYHPDILQRLGVSIEVSFGEE
jgi:hypothetical protein